MEVRKATSDGRQSHFSMVSDGHTSHATDTVKHQAYFHFSNRVLGTSRGHWSILLSIFFILLFLGMLLWVLAGGNADYKADLHDSFWISLMMIVDVGTQTSLSVNDPGPVRSVAVVISALGFVFCLTFLGMVVDLIRNLLGALKNEHSRVVASRHVLILGWGDKITFLLDELLESDRCSELAQQGWSRRRPLQVVILAQRPELEMAQDVRMHFHFQGIRFDGISFREGNPCNRTELMKVSAPCAQHILILAERKRESDQQIMQTLLALAALPGVSGLSGAVFAEMQNQESVHVVSALLPVAEGIVAREMVNRIIVLRAVVPSVGYCFLEMASFKANTNELYLRPVPLALLGRPLGEVCFLFPRSIVCGIVAQACKGSSVEVSQFMHDPYHILKESDILLMLAQSMKDADALEDSLGSTDLLMSVQDVSDFRAVVTNEGQLKLGPSAEGPKIVLMIGCPPDFPNFLALLDCYLAAKSEVHLLSQRSLEWRAETLGRYVRNLSTSLDADDPFKRISITHHIGLPTSEADIAKLPVPDADSALVLAEPHTDDEPPAAADSRNLTAVITLTRVSRYVRTATKKFKIATELLDAESQQVVDGNHNVRKMGSFVYTNALEAGVFATAVSDIGSYKLLEQLLDPCGSVGHIIAVPTRQLVQGSEALSFRDLQKRALQRSGGVLLGWRRQKNRYPEVNPPDKTQAIPWSAGSGDEFLLFRPHGSHRESLPSPDGLVGGIRAMESPSRLPGVPLLDGCA